MDPQTDQLPTTLLDLFSNPIISDNLLQYLPLSSISRIARTARTYHKWVLETPRVFRYLDLSKSRGAYTPLIARIDNGGHSWRAERMDENLTEDEFYAGPLRSVLNRLDRLRILPEVQVLVLDGLASVTHELVHEIVTDERYNVKLLSIRQCPNINQSRLQQLMRHICRPSRPEGTPRLQGLYLFTNPADDFNSTMNASTSGITSVDGAALGLLPTSKSQQRTSDARWYSASGRVIQHGSVSRSSWEETLQACSGIIAFDAVLCKSMHKSLASCLQPASVDMLNSKPGIAPIATVALGPDGCSGCGKAPEDTPIWGQSNTTEFPLLSPPPFSGKLIDAVRPPCQSASQPQRLVVACTWCLANRHCDSCHRWWCADCYNPKLSRNLKDLEPLSTNTECTTTVPQSGRSSSSSNGKDSVKVWNGLCVENCLVGEMMAGAGSNGMWA